jgi:signal transduction histidine kinase
VKTSADADETTRVPAAGTADTDAVKALNLLIHDLRAPLSVAQGYLRLLLQNRLESDADRQRAITQTMEALGRMGRLCDDAAAYVAEPGADEKLPTSVAQVAGLVGRVTEACTALGTTTLVFSAEPRPLTGAIRATQIDRVAQALAVILCAVRRATRDESVRVSVHEEKNEARFLLGCDDDRAALMSQPPEMFDPWRGGHGIALPLACRIVTEAGGRIWTYANARGAVGIALPEEASVP